LDAGIVALSTLNYRHDREYWEKWYPADFITECFPGQFRNWFYALLAESTAMENRPPFLTVFGYALAKDEHGQEMHKSTGNVIWFDDAAETMGVDVMRWMYCAHNPRVNLHFGYGPADEVRRRFLIPLWNIYSFFTTYANIDGWTPQRMDPAIAVRQPDNVLDRWILSRLQVLIKAVDERLGDYDAASATRSVEAFVDDLSNWYVRRSRRRFWKSEQDEDKNMAYWTLYQCLVTLIKLLAPFIPFVTEEIYQTLVRSVDADAPESVHHCDFPVAELGVEAGHPVDLRGGPPGSPGNPSDDGCRKVTVNRLRLLQQRNQRPGLAPVILQDPLELLRQPGACRRGRTSLGLTHSYPYPLGVGVLQVLSSLSQKRSF